MGRLILSVILGGAILGRAIGRIVVGGLLIARLLVGRFGPRRFRSLGRFGSVEGVALVEGGFMAWISGGEEAVRQTAERLRQMAAYGEVRLEADPEDPGITRLYCLTAGAEEEE